MTLAMDGQRESLTVAASATGTANAVDVVFGLHRQIKIDDVADGLDVDTAGGHIGGDQNANTTFLNLLKGA